MNVFKIIFLSILVFSALNLPVNAQEKESNSKSLEITVSVKKELMTKSKKDWSLYVYAARPNTRLPLSSFKAKLGDLPMKITLDESMYLLPDLTLKNAQEVIVIAKASESSDPHHKSPNNLIGKSKVLSFSDSQNLSLSIVIDRKDVR
ncbi:c-type cytochrome biogenesis protein CcmI/CycH [Aliikangiella coralliicola]|uniref:Cytochrome c-type biogenesis protein H Ig-like domain-containing protein n=1 Tax=Aliikangiella coralliicola TaxID=2592383 RepID=A0A545UGZ7_9GAMM|nr:hypothetical protein [Aliikangiella coralliicola]TQV88741.1 hypothetical protein FLL46_04205 [Aliikangiella coralliicola]